MALWQTGHDDVVFADSAKRVYVGIIVILREILVFVVEHLLRGSEFDREGANPSYSVVFAAKAVVHHLNVDGRMAEVWMLTTQKIVPATSDVSAAETIDLRAALCNRWNHGHCGAKNDHKPRRQHTQSRVNLQLTFVITIGDIAMVGGRGRL